MKQEGRLFRFWNEQDYSDYFRYFVEYYVNQKLEELRDEIEVKEINLSDLFTFIKKHKCRIDSILEYFYDFKFEVVKHSDRITDKAPFVFRDDKESAVIVYKGKIVPYDLPNYRKKGKVKLLKRVDEYGNIEEIELEVVNEDELKEVVKISKRLMEAGDIEEVLQDYLDKVREELKNGEGKELYKLFTSSRYETLLKKYKKTPRDLSPLGISFISAKVENEEDLIGIPKEGETKSQLVISYKRKIIPYKKPETENINLKVIAVGNALKTLKKLEEIFETITEREYEVIKDEKDIEDLIKIAKAIITEDIDEIYYSDLYFKLIDNKKITIGDETSKVEFEYFLYKNKYDGFVRAVDLYYRYYDGEKLETEEKIYIKDFDLSLFGLGTIIHKIKKLNSILEDDIISVQQRTEEYLNEDEPISKIIYELKRRGDTYFTIKVNNEIEFRIDIPGYVFYHLDKIIEVLEMIEQYELEREREEREREKEEEDWLSKLNNDDDDDIDVPF